MEQKDKQQPMEQVRDLLMAGDVPGALAHLGSLHPADQAEVIAALDAELRVPLLPRLPQETLADILEYLNEEPRRHVVMELEPAVLAPLLDRVDTDVAADVLHMLPPEQAEQVLLAMRTAPEVTGLLRHEDESAGGRMTADFVALHKEWTVDQALAYLRRTHPDAEQVYYLYVIDADHRLEGVVSLRHLVVATPDERIADIMTPEVISIRVDEDQEEAARILQRYNLVALPVVNEESRLVGVTTADDLMDVAQEEATEDMYRMVGLDEEESVLGPLAMSLRRRLPWLLVNLCTAFLAALTVNTFEDTISRVAALAVFMPVIAGHGGNTGTQVTTLVVRGLALGEVQLSHVLHIILKQAIFGLLQGVISGSLSALLAFLLTGNLWLALIVFSAMLGNVIIAAIAGSLIPLGMKRLRVDPALASAIWLTTFTDVMGFLLLLGLGTIAVDRLS
jgi:magnesium transporter